MINNVFYILAAIIIACWVLGVLPALGLGFLIYKIILGVAAIMVLIQLTIGRKLSN